MMAAFAISRSHGLEMVFAVDGNAVGKTVEAVLSQPRRYRHVVLSSPFIDERGARLIDRLYRRTDGLDVRVVIVSTPAVLNAYAQRWPPRRGFWLVRRPSLHAKLYVLIGRLSTDHVAVVTSANLTRAGLSRNVEVGLCITGSSTREARLIERLPFQVGLTSLSQMRNVG